MCKTVYYQKLMIKNYLEKVTLSLAYGCSEKEPPASTLIKNVLGHLAQPLVDILSGG